QHRYSLVDVAGAHGQHNVAIAGERCEPPGTALSRGHPSDTRTVDLVDDQLPRHSFDRLLTGAIDVRDGDDVGRGERNAELMREMASAREQMGLKKNKDALRTK